jgi:uncharacterized protein (DUF934 family)
MFLTEEDVQPLVTFAARLGYRMVRAREGHTGEVTGEVLRSVAGSITGMDDTGIREFAMANPHVIRSMAASLLTQSPDH